MDRRNLISLTVSLVYVGIFAGLCLQVGQCLQARQTDEPIDRQQFQTELGRLAEICERLNLKKEAELSRKWLAPARPDQHRLYLPIEFPAESGKKEFDSWRNHFIAARKRYAAHLYAQAKTLSNTSESAAYRLLWQVARENPEHAECKRVLGTLLNGVTARPQQRNGVKLPDMATLGTVNRWQSPNFQLFSRASAKESLAMASQLERFYLLWTQFFYELWAPPGLLQKRLEGGSEMWPDADKIDVMLLATRNEYLQLLGVAEDNIGASVGYYNPQRKLSIFYQADDLNETMFHELTHQMFSEASALKMAPVLEKVEGAWCIEGVALYMESLSQTSEGWTVGGLDSRRLQTARYRALRDEHWSLWQAWCKGTLQDWKSSKDIAVSYSHATGLTHLFLDNLLEKDNAKESYFGYIKSVYEGEQDPEKLFGLLGGTEQAAQLGYRKALTVTDQHLQTLASTPETVKQLVLSRSQLKDWTQLDKFKNLQWLDVSYTNVTSNDLSCLAAFSKLQRLSIESTKADNEAMPKIAKLKTLTELDLSLCGVDDSGLAYLANHPSLETLYLTGTKVTEKSMATLSTISKLKSCDINGTVITKDQWNAFRSKHPRLK